MISMTEIRAWIADTKEGRQLDAFMIDSTSSLREQIRIMRRV